RDIPYFIVPIIAPLLGACLGAAIYRFLIANNLPCHTCVEEENTR
ncbi:aquaporin, partial [Klebsiella pneumoniae]